MKKLTFLFSFFIFHFSFVNAQTLLNSKVPATQIKTINGAAANSSAFSNNGKPIILDFWATWCKPCIAELDAINDEYADWKKETGVKVIAVSVDDARTMAKVQSFIREKGWDYDIYLDPNQDFQHAMEVINCPCTFILDGNGKIAYIHNSYMEGDAKKLHAELLKIAGKK
ncbi:MAG TPA: TlpA disulfide reductase family protein [Bacteroidia bacterium]|jgi:cytochrome c biogenesis protein CcmG/thiol:disulfide interchange protein DsbE|nr:TlpA disulfide reductase family protein [Bacteroidia bacterium]